MDKKRLSEEERKKMNDMLNQVKKKNGERTEEEKISSIRK